MAQEDTQLTGKQQLFVYWYVKLLNGTQAAKRAGYAGDDFTLGQVSYENLKKPEIKGEIDRQLKQGIIGADALLHRISAQATVDVTPYTRPDGTLDVQALAAAGLGHLVIGIEPTANGVKVALTSPQTAQKLLARYHRLLGDRLEVDVSAHTSIDPDTLASLAQQLKVLQDSSTSQDDT